MAEVTQQQVVEYIKGITVLELSQLVKTLEAGARRVGRGRDADGDADGGGGGGAAAAEEKTEFTVTLTDIGRQQDQRDQGRPRSHEPRD